MGNLPERHTPSFCSPHIPHQRAAASTVDDGTKEGNLNPEKTCSVLLPSSNPHPSRAQISSIDGHESWGGKRCVSHRSQNRKTTTTNKLRHTHTPDRSPPDSCVHPPTMTLILRNSHPPRATGDVATSRRHTHGGFLSQISTSTYPPIRTFEDAPSNPATACAAVVVAPPSVW